MAQSETPASVEFNVGDVVHDRDDTDPNDALVVTVADVGAENWIAYGETTIAEDNPDYPADSPVVVVAFASTVDTHLDEWDREEPISVPAGGDYASYFYGFPVGRLTAVDANNTGADAAPDADNDSSEEVIPTDDSDPEPPTAVVELADRLAEGGMDVEIEDDGETLTVSKLGDTYRVRPGEVVEGTGPLHGRLESITKSIT